MGSRVIYTNVINGDPVYMFCRVGGEETNWWIKMYIIAVITVNKK